MYDSFNRRIKYLRISVTDRCNLRCTYCMPKEGIRLMSHQEVLSFEEIVDFVKASTKFGIEKIRLTGGEPLVRKGIVELVKLLSEIEEIKDLSMTTNGLLLAKFAEDLALAGLNRVNISLDTLDAKKFRSISRLGDIENVLKGISAAKKAGLSPVKINCVVQKNSEEKDAQDVRAFGLKNNLDVRFIKMMNLENGNFSIVEGGDGGHCALCSRLRLTASGKLKPCLFNHLEYDIRELGNEEALRQAIICKPKKGTVNKQNDFYNIGG